MRFAQQLGFAATDRVVVVHVDDVGMCHSTITAYQELSALNVVSAASTMVPCAWFPAVARWCREHAATDMGIHLTLNSEWEDYKWRPLTRASSLEDEAGYFKLYPEMTFEQVNADEVYAELRTQIDRALASGVDITHLDTHILALRHPDLIATYLRLSRDYRVPCSIVRRPDKEMERMARSPKDIDSYYRLLDEAEIEGTPVFDSWMDLPLGAGIADRLETGKRVLEALPQGLSGVVLHPATDSSELRAIASDWEGRVADFELLRSPEWARAVERAGVKVIGMHAIRIQLRRASRSE